MRTDCRQKREENSDLRSTARAPRLLSACGLLWQFSRRLPALCCRQLVTPEKISAISPLNGFLGSLPLLLGPLPRLSSSPLFLGSLPRLSLSRLSFPTLSLSPGSLFPDSLFLASPLLPAPPTRFFPLFPHNCTNRGRTTCRLPTRAARSRRPRCRAWLPRASSSTTTTYVSPAKNDDALPESKGSRGGPHRAVQCRSLRAGPLGPRRGPPSWPVRLASCSSYRLAPRERASRPAHQAAVPLSRLSVALLPSPRSIQFARQHGRRS